MTKVEIVAKALLPKCQAFGKGETPMMIAREFAAAAIAAIEATPDESDLATVAYISGAADARDTIKALRARLAMIEAAADDVLKAADSCHMHEKGVGGMTIDAQIDRTVLLGMRLRPIENLRSALEK